MTALLERIVNGYEMGRFSRREFVGYLSGAIAVLAEARNISSQTKIQSSSDTKSTFEALDLNHLMLKVSDLDRTEAFYQRHFGLRTFYKQPEMRFMNFGTNFIAFTKSKEVGMDHFCFTIEKYEQKEVVRKLKENNIEAELEVDRTYLYDPDGIRIQIAHNDHPGGRPKMTEDLLKKIYGIKAKS